MQVWFNQNCRESNSGIGKIKAKVLCLLYGEERMQIINVGTWISFITASVLTGYLVCDLSNPYGIVSTWLFRFFIVFPSYIIPYSAITRLPANFANV